MSVTITEEEKLSFSRSSSSAIFFSMAISCVERGLACFSESISRAEKLDSPFLIWLIA